MSTLKTYDALEKKENQDQVSLWNALKHIFISGIFLANVSMSKTEMLDEETPLI